jgi:hypothetical protein
LGAVNVSVGFAKRVELLAIPRSVNVAIPEESVTAVWVPVRVAPAFTATETVTPARLTGEPFDVSLTEGWVVKALPGRAAVRSVKAASEVAGVVTGWLA